jgi:hypothetical protein
VVSCQPVLPVALQKTSFDWSIFGLLALHCQYLPSLSRLMLTLTPPTSASPDPVSAAVPQMFAVLSSQPALKPLFVYVTPLLGNVSVDVGVLLSSVKVTAAPVNVFPALSVAVAWTV